jgi:hypothetical protein
MSMKQEKKFSKETKIYNKGKKVTTFQPTLILLQQIGPRDQWPSWNYYHYPPSQLSLVLCCNYHLVTLDKENEYKTDN